MPRNPETLRKTAQKRRARNDLCKEAAIMLKGGSCPCGVSHRGALQFHHRDPAQKVDTIMKMISAHPWTYSVEDLLIELEKCDLLCANCHAIHHWESMRDA